MAPSLASFSSTLGVLDGAGHAHAEPPIEPLGLTQSRTRSTLRRATSPNNIAIDGSSQIGTSRKVRPDPKITSFGSLPAKNRDSSKFNVRPGPARGAMRSIHRLVIGLVEDRRASTGIRHRLRQSGGIFCSLTPPSDISRRTIAAGLAIDQPRASAQLVE